MIKKLFLLYFKLIFSSAVTWTYYIVNLLFCMFLFYAASVSGGFENFYSVISALSYVEMIIACFAFCVAVVFARKKQVLEQTCFVPKEKSSLVLAVSVMLTVWPVILIPSGFCVIRTITDGTGALFCLRVILYTALRWTAFLAFFTAMGFILGRAVKSTFVYLISAPAAVVFSGFNEIILRRLFLDASAYDRYTTLLSIQHLYAGVMNVDYSSPNIDLFFLSKILSVVLMSAVLFYLMYLSYKNRRTAANCITAVLLVGAFILSSFAYTQLFPQKADETQKLLFAFNNGSNDAGYRITDYTGHINLSEHCEIECAVEIETGGNSSVFEMVLDEAFEIESILCGGRPLSYERAGDSVIIDSPGAVEGENIVLDFKYSGRPYYCNGAYHMTVFSTASASAFPPGFSFLPVFPGDGGQASYMLEVKSKNPVVSNLDTEARGNDTYMLSGQSALACIFSGHFQQETGKNGEVLITAKDYNKNYEQRLQGIDGMKCLNLDLGCVQTVGEISPKKVIYISCFLKVMDTIGAPLYFDDCLIINHFA